MCKKTSIMIKSLKVLYIAIDNQQITDTQAQTKTYKKHTDGYSMTGPTGGHRGDNDLETELRTTNYNRIDLVLRVLECRFSERDLQLGSVLAVLKKMIMSLKWKLQSLFVTIKYNSHWLQGG